MAASGSPLFSASSSSSPSSSVPSSPSFSRQVVRTSAPSNGTTPRDRWMGRRGMVEADDFDFDEDEEEDRIKSFTKNTPPASPSRSHIEEQWKGSEASGSSSAAAEVRQNSISNRSPTLEGPASASSARRNRPRSSPFSSPRKREATYESREARLAGLATSPDIQPSPRASAQYRSTQRSAKRAGGSACPDDCRCSDREIEMGRCACALGSASASGSSSRDSSPDVGEESRTLGGQVRMNWQRGERTPALSTARTLPSLERVSAQAVGSYSTARRPRPSNNLAASTSEAESVDAGASHSYSRVSAAGRPSLKATLARQSRAERLYPNQTGGANIRTAPFSLSTLEDEDEETDARRKRRREERDRLIRQRIEEKRKSRDQQELGLGLSPSTTIRVQADGADDSREGSQADARRERTLEEDVTRIRTLSRPPSSNSIAAFAAKVSPSRINLRRAPPLASSDGAIEQDVLQESIKLTPSKTLKEVLSQESALEEARNPTGRTSRAPSIASSSGFSFSPQRMSVEVPPSSPSTPGSSPRRLAHRRTGGGEGDVVSVAANLPANDPMEARQRLRSAFRSPIIGSPGSPHLVQEELSTSAPGAGNSRDAFNVSNSRKSVRFSPEAEFVEAQRMDSSMSSANDEDAQAEEEDSSEDEESVDDDANDRGEQTTELQDAQHADQSPIAVDASVIKPSARASAPTSSPGLVNTPIRLPPGAFGSPFALGRLPREDRENQPSFSVFTLRPHAKRIDQSGRQSPSSTPTRPPADNTLLPETPMPPGGLRVLKGKLLSSANATRLSPTPRTPFAVLQRQSASQVTGERGLPPSYSAIAASSPASSSFSMSRSNSVESGLDQLSLQQPIGEEGERSNQTDLDADGSAQPRQSTPPPSQAPLSPSLSLPRPLPLVTTKKSDAQSKRDSLADAVPWTHIEELRGIASPPDSRAATPLHNLDTDRIAESEGQPGGGEEDSIRVTLAKVVSALASPPKISPPLLPDEGATAGLPDLSIATKAQQAEEVVDASTLATRRLLLQVKLEDERARERRASRALVDHKQTGRLRSAQAELFSRIASLGVGQVWTSEAGNGSRAPAPLFSPSRIRPALFWLSVQLLILWLALLVMRHGADHLHRTVYYDPLYAHLYEVDTRGHLRYGTTSRSSWMWELLKSRGTRWLVASTSHPHHASSMSTPDSKTSLAQDWHSWPALFASLQHFPHWLALNLLTVEAAGATGAPSSSYTHVSHFVPV
ncbi:hypothetical protein BCV69DRAFT_216247 [Microstroma glucosiphilum]|uniref:Uncharacterized protein n=1 Tax=Pseudomicrostroma glucosiphilum TaxID=1684307 RepID=A0A316U5A1_9BASI|nr:hypothetical protein BCV69DRAFT_216247 [Pseudomicrostroma glucosiphilum]PWN20014.1 hypothetical protein BCV69DRAFT_216247 [Pseudomicrostroma glucosiphilum]